MLDLRLLSRLAAAAPSSAAAAAAARAGRDLALGRAAESVEADPAAAALVSREARLMIIDHDTGGRAAYETAFARPSWPGGRAGVTLGVGYDLSIVAPGRVHADWSPHLAPEAVALLEAAAGLEGREAGAHLAAAPALAALEIPWTAALAAFDAASLPRAAAWTRAALPGAEALSPHAFGALVALVHDRGPGMGGLEDARRAEMREIRRALRAGAPERAPELIRAMRRLAAGAGQPARLRRRDAEAALFEAGLAAAAAAPEGDGGAAPAGRDETAWNALAFALAVALRAEGAPADYDEDAAAEQAHLALGGARLAADGRAALADLERRARARLCDPAALDRGGDLAALDRALAAADAPAERLRAAIAASAAELAPALPNALAERLGAALAERALAALPDGAPPARGAVCAAWAPAAPPPHATPPDAAPNAAAPAARAAAEALLETLRAAPEALDADSRAALRAALGAGAERPAGVDLAAALLAARDAAAARPVDPVAAAAAVEAARAALEASDAAAPPPAARAALEALLAAGLHRCAARLADRLIARAPGGAPALTGLYARALARDGAPLAAEALLAAAGAQAQATGEDGRRRALAAQLAEARADRHLADCAAGAAGGDALRAALAAARAAHEGRPDLERPDAVMTRAALLARARARALDPQDAADPAALARGLIGALEAAPEDGMAPARRALLAEARFAAGDQAGAAAAYARFAAAAGPAEIEAALGRLRGVWDLRAGPRGGGAIVANLLECLSRAGPATLSAAERRALADAFAAEEAPAFADLFFDARTKGGAEEDRFELARVIDRAGAVCRLARMAGSTPRAAALGVLVDGSSLSPRLDPEASYVLTSAAAIWDPGADALAPGAPEPPLTPATALILFDPPSGRGAGETRRCAGLVWRAAEGAGGAALLALDAGVADLTPLAVSAAPPRPEDALALIGRPGAARAERAGRDALTATPARLLGLAAPGAGAAGRLRYAAIAPEGPGAPVFETRSWSLAGLHLGPARAAGPHPAQAAETHEGVWIQSISNALGDALRSAGDDADWGLGAAAGGAWRALTGAEDPALGQDMADEIDPDVPDDAYETVSPRLPAPDRPDQGRGPELWCPFAAKGPSMRARGVYPFGYPIGAVVHVTAGRFEQGDQSARTTMRLAAKTNAFFCISAGGTILQPGPLNRWGHHAGRSYLEGVGPALSKQLVGVALCGAGLLRERGGRFAPWWNKDFDPEKTLIAEGETRRAAKRDNILQAGVYHAVTAAQEEALIELLVWLHLNNPEVFLIDNVVGHDEVAITGSWRAQPGRRLGRKQDPGGAISMTMPELRAALARRVAEERWRR